MHAFFVISGFLVLASFDKRRDLWQFAKARLLRLLPALVVCLLLLSFVIGPLVTSLPTSEYIASRQTWTFFWHNASLYRYVEALPGVFADNRLPNAVDGTLWTLAIEARLYLIVALLGVLALVGSRLAASAAILLLVAVATFSPEHTLLIGSNPDHRRLGAFFAVGALLYVNREAVPLDGRVMLMLLVAAALSAGSPNYEFACGAVIAYGVFWLAFARKIAVPRYVQDYSYGIYLWGWPIQQLVNHAWPGIGPYGMLAVSLPAAWLAGAASWFLVERPSLSLKGAASGRVRGIPITAVR